MPTEPALGGTLSAGLPQPLWDSRLLGQREPGGEVTTRCGRCGYSPDPERFLVELSGDQDALPGNGTRRTLALARQGGVSVDLIHEFDLSASLKPPVTFGSRMFLEIAEGKVSGERLNGTLLSGGGDWITMSSHGWGQIDVRGQMVTGDGAYIYAHYTGLLELNDKVMNATASGTATGWNDQYFRTTPRFETGDERYSWMTTNLFVAEGHLLAGGVKYRVFRVS
jgi:hypothetical protein